MPTSRLFHVEEDEDVLILILHSHVSSLADVEILDQMEQFLQETDFAASQGVVVDFERASYFGSIMLEALRMLWTKVREARRRMTLCNVSEVGRDILAVARFDRLWPVFDSRQEAIEAVKR